MSTRHEHIPTKMKNTTDTKHTAGPFTSDGIVINGPSACFEVASLNRAATVVEMLNRGWNGDPVRAAAPELLESVRELLSVLNRRGLLKHEDTAVVFARAAIAKATGRDS